MKIKYNKVRAVPARTFLKVYDRNGECDGRWLYEEKEYRPEEKMEDGDNDRYVIAASDRVYKEHRKCIGAGRDSLGGDSVCADDEAGGSKNRRAEGDSSGTAAGKRFPKGGDYF